MNTPFNARRALLADALTLLTIGCLLAGIACILSGCTTFHVKQTDTSPGERVISSDIQATSWFSSAQTIAKIKAIQTDKTQSFGSDAVGQQGATNMVEALKALDSILGKIKP